VCHAVLQDPEFFLLLLQIDEEIAAEVRQAGCGRCGAVLHSACYPRKPRGCPAQVREQYVFRFSFCCARCDRRTTPASVRFLGRRVYVAVMLMLVSPPGGTAGRAVCEALSVPARTLARWRSWWQEALPRSRFWQCARARFSPPLEIGSLPQSLLERFVAATSAQRLAQALTFISPLSVPAMSG
jgi:hypothetical protein